MAHALVEAVVRAELAGAATMHPGGHELCVRRLANLVQLASSYREGREWSCECHYCRLLAGVRNYLAHHWARDHAAFAISAGPSNVAATGTRQDDGAGGSDPYGYAPQVDIELVSRRLKERRKFDAAARVLGKGARRFNLAPAVEGCLRCLSASHAGWRSEHPLPELADHLHDCPGADLLELARQRRQASAGRVLASSDWRAEPGRDGRQGGGSPSGVIPNSRCRAGCRHGAAGHRETSATEHPIDE